MRKLLSHFFYFLSLVLIGLVLLTVRDFGQSLTQDQSILAAMGFCFYYISQILDSNRN